jgi:hypothetical protein
MNRAPSTPGRLPSWAAAPATPPLTARASRPAALRWW